MVELYPTDEAGRPAYDEAMLEAARGAHAITGWLIEEGYPVYEGGSTVEQLAYLMTLAQQEDARLIAETGFNTGTSAYAFLASGPDTHVISFDLGDHDYVQPAKTFIDRQFPGRHTLVIGDSRHTIPMFVDGHPDIFADLIFIDGGHSLAVARADLANLAQMGHRGGKRRTAIVMDDTVPWFNYGVGPTRAWQEAIEAGHVAHEAFVGHTGLSGELELTDIFADQKARRAWAVGKIAVSGQPQSRLN
jgi:predicted O-methyltransferase YrrM